MRILGVGARPKGRAERRAAAPSATFDVWRAVNAAGTADAPEPWLAALVLVGFDLDKGQIVEACVPPAVLSPAEQETICYHAMPDSAAGGNGQEDAMYSFRVLRDARGPAHIAVSEGSGASGSLESAIASDVVSADDVDGCAEDDAAVRPQRSRLLLAHTLFRQAPDPSNPRGFFQKALVLVTSSPCVTLPRVLLTTLAADAFVYGERALERAVLDIRSWPDPRVQTSARALTLPFMGRELSVSLPQSFLSSFAAPQASLRESERSADQDGYLPLSPSSAVSDDHSLGQEPHPSHAGAQSPPLVRKWPCVSPSASPTVSPFHEVNIAQALGGACDKIWSLWELLVLGEPIAVLASTPSQTSAAVLGLMGLIHPLPFVGDWRPYFCIQDPSYMRLYSAKSIEDVVPRGAIYGVTNAHMIATLQFPHILTVSGTDGVGTPGKPGLKSSYRPSLHRSRQLLSLLNSSASGISRTNSKTSDNTAHEVRACVLDKVTRPFLRAFERYLVPTWGDGRPVTEEPYASDPFGRKLTLIELDLGTFPTAEDLSSPGVMNLFKAGAMSRTRARTFYGKFVNGPVFASWWRAARLVAEEECSVLHRTDVLEACVRGTGITGTECSQGGSLNDEQTSRISDLSSRVRQELAAAGPLDRILRMKLLELMQSLTGASLPDTRQAILASS